MRIRFSEMVDLAILIAAGTDRYSIMNYINYITVPLPRCEALDRVRNSNGDVRSHTRRSTSARDLVGFLFVEGNKKVT